MGLPRSGTTALSQYIARDPAMRSIRRWEVEWPAPPPVASEDETDPRIAAMERYLARRDAEAPDRKTKINYDASDPSEHSQLMQYTFLSYRYWGYYNIPSYDAWLSQQDLTPAYAYLNRVLKLLSWKCPAQHWNLKHPSDILAIPAILRVWPDARLVWTHRDPGKTIPSVASFIETERKKFVPSVDRAAIGVAELERRRRHMPPVLAARAALAPGRIVDVYNVDLVRDPIGTVAETYARVGLDFTPAFAERLKAHIDERPKGQFGAHRYEAEDYGIDAATVRSAFADYIAQCRVPIEG
nr:sulfotransferase [Sphingobium sp. JAI105]